MTPSWNGEFSSKSKLILEFWLILFVFCWIDEGLQNGSGCNRTSGQKWFIIIYCSVMHVVCTLWAVCFLCLLFWTLLEFSCHIWRLIDVVRLRLSSSQSCSSLTYPLLFWYALFGHHVLLFWSQVWVQLLPYSVNFWEFCTTSFSLGACLN